MTKLANFTDWKGEEVDYVETTLNGEKFWFTTTELLNAKARWIRENWDNLVVKLRE